MFRRNKIKDDVTIRNAQRLSEYRQVDPELRRLDLEYYVKATMIKLLSSK